MNVIFKGLLLGCLVSGLCWGGDIDEEGFVSLFNGKDLTGWVGATNGYAVEKGVLYCAKGGNLYTEKEYSDFILRFEFIVRENGNNGLAIRVPQHGTAAYTGMELQILDNSGSWYKNLQPYQYHGSIYGVVPAKRGFQKKPGEWNFQEVRAIGSRITVILNGAVIVDADISKITKTMDGLNHFGLHNKKGYIGWLGHGHRVDWRNIRIKEVSPTHQIANPTDNLAPKGFVSLFNGKDLSGWKGVTTAENFDNPIVRRKASPQKKAEMQKLADRQMAQHWFVRDGALFFDGQKGGYSLATAKEYKDFELYVDWRILSVKGDSGLYLRGTPQVQIWDAHNQWHIGSGGLYNNQKNPSKALCIADKQVGSWNTFYIKMVGDQVTVRLNDKLVVDGVPLENYWDRTQTIFPSEQIELQCHGDPIEFKNIYIREF